MKKITILFAVASLVYLSTAQAQDTTSKKNKNPHLSAKTTAFSKGGGMLRFGVEPVSLLYRYTSTNSNVKATLPISGSLDIDITDELSLRGYFGYSKVSASYDLFGYTINEDYTFKIIGIGLNYHFEGSKTLDPYIGGLVAYNVVSGGLRYSDNGSPSTKVYDETISFPTYDAHIGVNWLLSPEFGLFGEVGYGFSIVKLGICLNINPDPVE